MGSVDKRASLRCLGHAQVGLQIWVASLGERSRYRYRQRNHQRIEVTGTVRSGNDPPGRVRRKVESRRKTKRLWEYKSKSLSRILREVEEKRGEYSGLEVRRNDPKKKGRPVIWHTSNMPSVLRVGTIH